MGARISTPASSSGWETPVAGGKATRSSSKPPTFATATRGTGALSAPPSAAALSSASRASIPMTKVKGPIYEYACHEGNYALPGILAGQRKEEREAAQQR